MKSYEYNKEYAKRHRQKIAEITITMGKEEKEKIKEFAKERGESVNSLVKKAIKKEMEKRG